MNSFFLIIVNIFLIFEAYGVHQNPDIVIKNKGIGGNSTNDLLKWVENDVIAEKPDIVIVLVGNNDMLNPPKMISYKNYSSNLDQLIQRFEEHNIEVVLVSPPPADNVYLFNKHDRELFMEAPNKKLEKISERLKQKALQKKLTFVDILTRFSEVGIPIHNQDKIIRNVFNSGSPDGGHPTTVGYQLIAQEIFNVLVTNGKIKKHSKIICFGDSITVGVHVLGEGTASGETYPAYLKAKIDNYFNN